MLGKALGYLDGKKTIIGTACLVASTFMDQVLVGFWHVGEYIPKATEVMQTLDWTGLVLGGTGLTHKTAKYMRQPKEETPDA